MDTILEQKRKGQKKFREKIDQFLAQSPYTKESDQLIPQIIQELLTSPNFEGVCINNRINVQKLCEKVSLSEGHAASKQLLRVLGNRKQMKVSELHQLLKNYELHQFDIEEEIVRYFFENGSFSMQKLESVMAGLGFNSLNNKDKQILIECFDYDRNKSITRSDIEAMMNMCIKTREDIRKQKQTSKDLRISMAGVKPEAQFDTQ